MQKKNVLKQSRQYLLRNEMLNNKVTSDGPHAHTTLLQWPSKGEDFGHLLVKEDMARNVI